MADATRMLSQTAAGVAQRFRAWLVVTWRDGGMVYQTLLVAWFLGMTSVPIVGWTLGAQAQVTAIVVTTVAQTLLGVGTLALTWGWLRAIGAALIVGVLTWGAEALGTATGFPFGDYYYTDALQPQLAHVPLLIPIAWMMVLPSAWAIAMLVNARVQPRKRLRLPFIAALSALALTAWDFGLDPQMVGWGLWVWPNGGLYFGIPLSNFAGWFGTAFIGTIAVWLLVRPAEGKLATDQLLLIYGLTWFLMSFGLILFWHLAWPGLVLLLVMGGILLLAVRVRPS